MEKLLEFATSEPEFMKTGQSNIRHRIEDVIMLIILVRMSGCTGHADKIEFGKHNLIKFRSMEMQENAGQRLSPFCLTRST